MEGPAWEMEGVLRRCACCGSPTTAYSSLSSRERLCERCFRRCHAEIWGGKRAWVHTREGE